MNTHLLAIESLWLAVGFGLLSFLGSVLIEAVVLYLFKLNPFGRCFRDSLLANIGSALLCLLLLLILNKVEIEGETHLMIFSFFFFVASFFESWLIRLLNNQLKWSKILLASLVMNLITYTAGYYIFSEYMF
jgi:hypothetical protein